jgi:hypothetical protein
LNAFNSEELTAITSICAVFISIISIVFTVIFSSLQQKHNKNSVRPISAIKINDYEDKIAVRIDNVGTGPLIIKKALFINNTQKSSSLISMMPDIKQNWITFTEEIDGWTIPVNGKLTLIEIIPRNDETRNIIRKKLSEIEVKIEYCDIYNTKFNDERELAFFGRHFSRSELQQIL